MAKLTPKQEGFCVSYLHTGNATQSYRDNYDTKNLKDSTIWVKASQTMAKDSIKERVRELRKSIADTGIANAKEIQSFWTTTMFSNEGDMKDRVKCSELLGKCIGIFEKDNKQKGEALSKCFLPMKNKDN